MRTVLGIDLGATKIACGLVREDGSLQSEIVVEATGAVSAEQTAQNVLRAIEQALEQGGVGVEALAGIGLGSAGPIDANGTFGDVDTLPHLHGFALGEVIRRCYPTRLAVDNDANCFALAEATFGAGRGEAVVVGITLGTGLGCGIVLDGRIFAGTTGNGGEVGRCLLEGLMFDEALSGAGVARIFGEISGQQRRAEQIQALAEREKDPAALQAWGAYGAKLGAALGIIAALLDPGVIVLGGSVAAAFPWFSAQADARMRAQLSTPAAQRARLCPSALGRRAGCLGAAALVFRLQASGCGL